MKVTYATRPPGRCLVLEGDIDHENVGQLIDALRGITRSEATPIMLDLTKSTYIDSAGIGAIYDLVESLNGSGEIEITGVSLNLWRIFEVAGLTVRRGVRILPQEDTHRSESQPAPLPWKDGGRVLPMTQSFPDRLDQLPHIRDFVADQARNAGLDESRTFNLQVAVSEAAANAIEHGRPAGDIELSASRAEGRLTITVSHPGHFLPRLGEDPSRSHRGMGIPLMLALTDEVMVSQPPGAGTRVSLSLYLA
jgi:serine/threonine-protein kinase RsbW